MSFGSSIASCQNRSDKQRDARIGCGKKIRIPALRFKKVRDVYSVRIGNSGYRAVAVDVPDGFLWIWIGPHDQYERLLTGLASGP